MNKFSDYKKYFEIDLNNFVSDIMKMPETQKTIIDYNQKEQLSHGIDALGQRIETIASQEQKSGFPYAIFTVSERSKKGLQVRNVDLKDTGELWDSMKVTFTETGSLITAQMQKENGSVMDNFDKKYDFFGLNDNSLENFTWDYFFDIFSRKLKSLFQD